jgi:hypothetical protein
VPGGRRQRRIAVACRQHKAGNQRNRDRRNH